MTSSKSDLEEHFLLQMRSRCVPPGIREHVFHPTRKWRFDFAWPDHKLGVEIQGGVWSGGAHGRGSGITRNYEKYNAAAIQGWRVLQGDASMVRNAVLVEQLQEALLWKMIAR